MFRSLFLESLESRDNPCIPQATLGPIADPLIGENFGFQVTFDNVDPTDPGFGPYVDLILPATGADGAPAPDGVTFVSATYLGNAVTAQVFTFGAGGTINHPFAKTNTGAPVVVTGTPGDQLVVLTLPFGSFAADQPPATIQVQAKVSDLADIGTPLTITARGGFQFGCDPLDNPTTDPSTQQAVPSTTTVTPELFTLRKEYFGPENETATGPNYPHLYRVVADIANGATLTNFDLTDRLSNQMQFSGAVSTSTGSGAATTTAIATPSQLTPGGTLTRRFDSVTGGPGDADAVMIFSFFVPRTAAGGGSVIDPNTGDDALSLNDAAAIGDWVPNDPRDPATPGNAAIDAPGPEHTLTAKSIATQKSVRVVGGGPAQPGAVLEYTVDFQVSDYFTFGDLALADTFADGQRLDPTFTPTFQVVDRDGNVAGSFATGGPNPDLVVDLSQIGNDTNPATDGSTTLRFDVSRAMVNAGAPDGIVRGARTPNLPDPIGPSTQTTGRVVFRTVIQNAYSDTYLPNSPTVVQGDVMGNRATMSGTVRDNNAPTTVLDAESDDTRSTIAIPTGTLAKRIYAVNGVLAPPGPVGVRPGDTITYRLTYRLPTSDIDGFSIDDYLPLPVLNATELTGPVDMSPNPGGTTPVPGKVRRGPADTFFTLSGITPTLTTAAGSNSLNLAYGFFDAPISTPTTIDLLYTVTVTTAPFADQLLLVNQARSTEQPTNGPPVTADATGIFQLQEPDVRVSKGVVSAIGAAPAFSPSLVGPVNATFAAPGVAGPAFSGTINSVGLATRPVNSNLSGVDAADLVKFAIVLQNVGTSGNGAFDVLVRDTLPAGFQIPVNATGLNLQVANGAGDPISFTPIAGGLFGGGLQLDDPGPTNPDPGALDRFDPIDGANIAVVTYDLQLIPGTRPNTTQTNVATLAAFSNVEGGDNFIPDGLTDDARVVTRPVGLTKELLGTEIESTTPGNANGSQQVVIGEIATYRVTVAIPEGTVDNLQVADTLPAGLSFVDLVSATVSNPADVTLTGSLTPTVGANGSSVAFNLGTVVNANRDNAVPETITFVYRAVARNVAGNQSARSLANSVRATYTGGSVTRSAPAVTVVEPAIVAVKAVAVGGGGTVGDSGDPIDYTLAFRDRGAIDAFDVTVNDPLPTLAGASAIASPTFVVNDSAGLLTVADFELVGSDATGYTFRTRPGVSFDLLAGSGRTVSIVISGTLAAALPAGAAFDNRVTAAFTSLDGDPGQRSPFDAASTERTGADGVGGLNDYVAFADAETITIGTAAPFKGLRRTSEADSLGTNVAIGEIARYRLTVRLPEATVPQLVAVDSLPLGMRFLDPGQVRLSFLADTPVTTDPDLAGADNDANPPTFVLPANRIAVVTLPDGRQQLTFDLGDITNNDADANFENLLLEFNALVENVPSNQAGTTLTNAYAISQGGGPLGPPSNTSVLRVIEPVINNVVKTVSPSTGDAGDVATFTVTASNTGTATAYNARMVDALPAGLTLIPGSVSVTQSGGAAGFADASVGNTVDGTAAIVPVGATVTVTYRATLDVSVAPGTILTNTAKVTYTSLPGPNGTTTNPTGSSTPGASGAADGERDGSGQVNDYADQASASITTPTSAAVDKLQPQPIVYVLGDLVTYDIVVTLPEGTARNVVVNDQLPRGLEYVSNSVVTTAAASNGSLARDFAGSVPNPTVTTAGGDGADVAFSFPAVVVAGDNDPANNSYVIRMVTRAVQTDRRFRPIRLLVNDTDMSFSIGTGGTVTVVDPTPTIVVVVSGAAITGNVYFDANDNGLLDPGERPIPGVTLTLTGTNVNNLPVNLTTTTGADGGYRFDRLLPGTYAVTETQPAGYLDGQDTADNLTPIPGSANTDVIGGLTLSIGQTDPNNNFGERPLPGKRLLLGSAFENGLPDATGYAPSAADAQYVQSLYRAVLGRDANAQGLDGYTAMLAAGTSREDVAASIWTSAEHRGLQVDALYRELLGRAADPDGRAAWVAALALGLDERDARLAFVTSDEYVARVGDGDAYLTALYRDLLGRPATGDELDAYRPALSSAGRVAVAASIIGSEEAAARRADHFYVATLGRRARPGERYRAASSLVSGDQTLDDLAIGVLAGV